MKSKTNKMTEFRWIEMLEFLYEIDPEAMKDSDFGKQRKIFEQWVIGEYKKGQK